MQEHTDKYGNLSINKLVKLNVLHSLQRPHRDHRKDISDHERKIGPVDLSKNENG